VRSHTFPSTATPDEGISKSEAVNVLSALFRPTPVNSAACDDGCIVIDTYPEFVNHRRSGPEFWIIKSGYVLLFFGSSAVFVGN
jgi:hypothetical protein